MAALEINTDFKFTYEAGATWGTAVDSASTAVPCKDMTIDQPVDNHDMDINFGQNFEVENQHWQDTYSGIPTAKMTGVVITPTHLKDLLPCLLQNSTAWAAAGSVWSIFTQTRANLPQPINGSSGAARGYFKTLTRNGPTASKDMRIASAVSPTWKFYLDMASPSKCLMADIDWIGKGYSRGLSVSATVTDPTLTPIYTWGGLGTFMFSTFDLTSAFKSFEWTVSNNARPAADLPGGEIIFDPFTVSGKFTVARTSDTETMKGYVQSYTQGSSGNAKILKAWWGDGTVSSAGELNLQSYVYLTNWSENYDNGELLDFEFKGVLGSSSTLYPFHANFYL